MIEAVEKRRDRAALVQRTACTHCGAAGGEPCRKPDGSPYVKREPWRTNMFTSEWTTPRFHAARQSAAVALFNSAMPDSWRADLRSSPSAIATVEREVRASALYQTMEAA